MSAPSLPTLKENFQASQTATYLGKTPKTTEIYRA